MFLLKALSPKIASLILGVFCFLHYRKLPRELKIFNLYIWGNLAIDIVGSILARLNLNNLAFLQLYLLMEMILLLSFLKECTLLKKRQKALQWIMAIGVIIMIIDPFVLNSLHRFNNISIIYSKFLLIIVSTVSLFSLYSQDGKQKDYPRIYGGIILYAGISIIVFSLGNLLIEADPSQRRYIWFPNVFSFVIFMIMAGLDIHKTVKAK